MSQFGGGGFGGGPWGPFGGRGGYDSDDDYYEDDFFPDDFMGRPNQPRAPRGAGSRARDEETFSEVHGARDIHEVEDDRASRVGGGSRRGSPPPRGRGQWPRGGRGSGNPTIRDYDSRQFEGGRGPPRRDDYDDFYTRGSRDGRYGAGVEQPQERSPDRRPLSPTRRSRRFSDPALSGEGELYVGRDGRAVRIGGYGDYHRGGQWQQYEVPFGRGRLVRREMEEWHHLESEPRRSPVRVIGRRRRSRRHRDADEEDDFYAPSDRTVGSRFRNLFR